MADLANAWLIRRLPSLHAQVPSLDLHLRLHAEITPPDPYSVDVGIWHQRIDLPGFECHNLIEDHVIAVASPALLARYPGFTLADVPRLPMLRFALRPWRDWLEAAGLPGDEPERHPHPVEPAVLGHLARGQSARESDPAIPRVVAGTGAAGSAASEPCRR